MRFGSIYFLFLIALTTSCESGKKPTPGRPPPTVTDFVVEPHTIPAVFDFIGFAASSHPVEIRARVEGYLDKIAYMEGQFVDVGDLMFQIDPKPFEAKVAQYAGEVARQKAILENAKLTVARLSPLYQQKAASKKDLDNATAEMLASAAAVESAQAQLLDAQINLGYTTIRSPIAGYSDKAKYREGALIAQGPSSMLTSVSVLDPIWVYFNISENDIVLAQQQTADKTLTIPGENSIVLPENNEWEVEAITSEGTTFPYKGKVDFSAPTYDQSTGTLQARAVFPNPKADLRPGQFVRVKVHGAKRPNALYVPQRALVQKTTGMFVYLITQDNKVIAQDVETGAWYGDYQIITNGLKAGDHIVVDGTNKVIPGAPVTIVGSWKPETSTDSDKKKSS